MTVAVDRGLTMAQNNRMVERAEIEAKYRLRAGQRAELTARLGKPDRMIEQHDSYFDVMDRVLRIRQEGDDYWLTRKGPVQYSPDGIKIRQEIENSLSVNCAALLAEIFPELGHRKLITVRKERWEYKRAGYLLCLDRIVGLTEPDFLEIEMVNGDLSLLRSLRDSLGLAAEQIERHSYAALVALADSTPP
ncbi:MAG: CYTH domain-containing protein, partial [Cyanobacteria bacterium NC_groundwater_1444_Ag_S-0.65um_54_12]|nr:CYTH domain-containing protein [Cyanobacteria bacterium NC_groundwater_1444_Ag_S-0.65um_54_12]